MDPVSAAGVDDFVVQDRTRDKVVQSGRVCRGNPCSYVTLLRGCTGMN